MCDVVQRFLTFSYTGPLFFLFFAFLSSNTPAILSSSRMHRIRGGSRANTYQHIPRRTGRGPPSKQHCGPQETQLQVQLHSLYYQIC